MDIRPYTAADRAACLAVCDSVLPGTAREAFGAYLDEGNPYFVAEHEGGIIGGGGFRTDGDGARLLWGMVHRDWQRQGLGRFLLFFRMREITKQADVTHVHLVAPPDAAGFYAAQGFREISRDGEWVTMSKRLAVCP